ncbi:MAG: type VI secretion system baseplate subunit TssG [Planctomycetota bacterium]
MASTPGQSNRTVSEQLEENPADFGFFQAVRLLQREKPDAPKIGHQGPPTQEGVRFRPNLSLAFPLADIESVEPEETPQGYRRHRMDVNFMGLYGPASPLPVSYTEDMLREEEPDSLLRGYLDIFHHRIISLFYRCWEKYRHSVQYDDSGKDYFSDRFLSLIGNFLQDIPHDSAVPTGRLLSYAGLLTQQPKSAAALREILKSHFDDCDVDIQQCLPSSSDIPKTQHLHLGQQNNGLGHDSYLGTQVTEHQSTFGVKVGPLDYGQYESFMPTGQDMQQLRELVDMFNTDCLQYEVKIVLKADATPECRLNSNEAKLGWSAWLGGSEPENKTLTFKFKEWKHGRG